MKPLFVFLAILLALAGCAQQETVAQPSAPAEAIAAEPSDTPAPTDTATPEPTNTATAEPTETPSPQPSDTATPGPTNTATPTETATPAPSDTPTSVPTATATATTPPQPPAPTSPPPPPAGVFPNTEILPFSRDRFLYELGQLALNLEDLDGIFVQLSFGHVGNCHAYLGLHNQWTTSRAGFTDVPAAYASLYAEYRGMLQEAESVSAEIYTVCSSGGGTVSDQTDANIRAFLTVARPRLQQILTAATQLG
jgi:hypothetical protein